MADLMIVPAEGSGWEHPCPTVVVGSGWSRRKLPLGLDRPVELRGGDRLTPDGMATALPLDWCAPLLDVVEEECRSRLEAGDVWFQLPPLALEGRAGSGRGHVARQIARYAGVPFLLIDIAGEAGVRRLRDASVAHSVALPNSVVVAIASTCCANPVVYVTGADGATGEALGLLTAMVDPLVGARWVEESIEASVDLSHFTWLVETTDVGCLPLQLASILGTVGITSDLEAGELVLLGLLDEVVAELGCGPPDGGTYEWLRDRLEHYEWRIHRDVAALRAHVVAAYSR